MLFTTSTMDEHPEHWKNTLMGVDFWRDAVDYEAELSESLDISKRS